MYGARNYVAAPARGTFASALDLSLLNDYKVEDSRERAFIVNTRDVYRRIFRLHEMYRDGFVGHNLQPGLSITPRQWVSRDQWLDWICKFCHEKTRRAVRCDCCGLLACCSCSWKCPYTNNGKDCNTVMCATCSNLRSATTAVSDTPAC